MKRLTISTNACTETLALLIAVAWADGRLEDKERDGVRGAAEVLNLPKALRDRLEKLLEKPVSLDDLLFETLSARERAFAFVAAAWMAGIDAKVDAKEAALLLEIGKQLSIEPARQKELAKITKSLDPLPDGVKSWSAEITKLFKAIPPQLEEPGGEFEVEFK